LAKFGEPYLDLGKEIAKSPTAKSFYFYRGTVGSTRNISSYNTFSQYSSAISALSKNSKI